jgi:hypothetical protein
MNGVNNFSNSLMGTVFQNFSTAFQNDLQEQEQAQKANDEQTQSETENS